MNGNDLINTSVAAPRQLEMLLSSIQAYDYYYMRPYPAHAFGPLQWPLEKGPIPTPLPYAQLLISEGAEFVFRNGSPAFSVADDDTADTLLQDILDANDMPSTYVSVAEANGNHGAIAVKFSVDMEDARCPIRFSFLTVPQECRLWVDPHDAQRVLMARIQYPYRDQFTGQWYYFREEWTDQSYVTYVPRFAGSSELQGAMQLTGWMEHLGDLGDGPAWQIDKTIDNPFCIVPVGLIRNKAVMGNPLGEGDLWHSFRIIDRIALTMHGEDRSSQFHSEPVNVAINAKLANGGQPQPGETLSILQNSKEGGPPDYKLLEANGAAREFSYRAIEKWEELLYKQAGLSRVDTAAVSNKGNMTALALQMTYARTIGTSDRKRQLWQEGFGTFLRAMLIGLRNLGAVKAARGIDDAVEVSCSWPDYFAATDDDKAALTDRTDTQVKSGFLTPDRGAERIAAAEGMPKSEVAKLLAELGSTHVAMKLAMTAQLSASLPQQDDRSEMADTVDALGGDNNFVS